MSISGERRPRSWAAPVRRHPFLDRAAPVLTHIWPKPAAGTARPPAPTLPAALLDDTQRLFIIAGPHPAIYTRLEANAGHGQRGFAHRGDARSKAPFGKSLISECVIMFMSLKVSYGGLTYHALILIMITAAVICSYLMIE